MQYQIKSIPCWIKVTLHFIYPRSSLVSNFSIFFSMKIHYHRPDTICHSNTILDIYSPVQNWQKLQIWHVSTHTQVTFSTQTLLVLLMSAFFAKISVILAKIIILPVLEVRDFLVLFSVFVRSKVTINENISFADYGFGIRLVVCSKLTVNWKKENDVTIS